MKSRIDCLRLPLGLLLLIFFSIVKAESPMQVSDFLVDFDSIKEKEILIIADVLSTEAERGLLIERGKHSLSVSYSLSWESKQTQKSFLKNCGMGSICQGVVLKGIGLEKNGEKSFL